jgi:hypothetical protein
VTTRSCHHNLPSARCALSTHRLQKTECQVRPAGYISNIRMSPMPGLACYAAMQFAPCRSSVCRLLLYVVRTRGLGVMQSKTNLPPISPSPHLPISPSPHLPIPGSHPTVPYRDRFPTAINHSLISQPDVSVRSAVNQVGVGLSALIRFSLPMRPADASCGQLH